MASSPPLHLLLAVAVAALLSAFTADARLLRRVSHSSHLSPQSLCQKAEYPMLCQSLTTSLHTLSPKSLTEAAIQEAAAKANIAKATAARVQSAPGTDKGVAANLGVCQTNFGDTVDNLQTALKYLGGSGRHADIMINLSAAVSNVETCDDGFAENPGMVSPIAHVSTNLSKLVRNSLALADSLK